MQPILREVPFSFETERLLIRGPLPGDGAVVRTAVLESLNELRAWMPWAVNIPDETGYEAIIREKYLDYLARRDLMMLLWLKGTDTLIGGSGLHKIDWRVPKFEIGYWVRTAYTGNGYITEAVKGITKLAFDVLGAKRVEIRCDSLNERSAAVARRAGYPLEATLRHHDRHHLTGNLRDTLIFALVAD
ncbi:MAG: N-acetyltransferase [Chloroflexi bacterium]|nr:MAG: N-acetyltransferase [Chloroflexota bacterium]